MSKAEIREDFKTEETPLQTPSAKDKDKERPIAPPIAFSQLFRYATKSDYILMIIGSIAAAANGVAMPAFALIFGKMAGSFGPGQSADHIVDTASVFALDFFYVGLGSWVASYISFAGWMIAGERQTIKFREEYFKALLRQEIGWYDKLNPNELATRVSSQCQDIQGGIAEKCSTFIFTMSMVAAGFIIGFATGWQLALVLCAAIPLMTVAGTLFVYAMQKSTEKTNQAYAESGAIAEQALNAVRTVQALGGEDREVSAYARALETTKKSVAKFGIFSGFALGLIFFAVSAMYALGFYFGSNLVSNQTWNPIPQRPYNLSDVLTCFFAVMMGSFSTAQLTPCMKAFALAKAAGAEAISVIDRKSLISIEDPKGAKLDSMKGEIVFEEVNFTYPNNPQNQILKSLSFKIEPYKKTALVGESGCGKSTCMQIIERFYDVDSGSVKLDGVNLRDVNLRWLRESIGYVGQEPALFATSIRDNLKFANDKATEEEVIDALKKANAYDFVMALEKQLDTFVGTSGSQLSGGQKQRLAIARAILKKPKILLLDEATSALDRKNEREIQDTLDKVSEGITTIVIAHRLTTIRNSDKIIVLEKGVMVEEGNHEELIEKKSKYYHLQQMQLGGAEENANQNNKNGNKEEIKSNNAAHIIDLNINLDLPTKLEVKTSAVPESSKTLATKAKPEAPAKPSFNRLLSYNKPEMKLFVFGICMALVNGAIFPTFAIILSNFLDVLANPSASDYHDRANLLSLMFLVTAIGFLVFNTLQLGIFAYTGECLTHRIRCEVFRKFLKMNPGWYDRSENNPGSLTSKLASDAALINSLTSSILGITIQSLSSFITGMTIAFSASWQLTLVCLATAPLVGVAGQMQAKFNQGFSAGNEDAYKEAGGFISEAVTNMRTVASFGRESAILKAHNQKLQVPLTEATKKGQVSGLVFGFSNMAMFGTYAIVFYVGALFIKYLNLDSKSMFMAIFGVMFAAFGSGNASQFMPDVGAAQNAAVSIFAILDTKPEIDIDDPEQNVRKPIEGEIEFKNVSFKYPTREKKVFEDLSFKISKGQKVALVGPSGCGKSTCMQLLLRFYDVTGGEILVDGINIKKYDLRHLRSYLGVVSQEPTLFNGTIEYNFKYTKPEATMEEIRAAAQKANALGFIESNDFDVLIKSDEDEKKFGTGFQRKVGPKGSQISGGQKQRIAIARAILKKPTVMLLDEATSALDSKNEEIVQQSLNDIMRGLTSMTIAHRIPTIKDSDEILVFKDGQIVERGMYEDLRSAQGVFYNLEMGTS